MATKVVLEGNFAHIIRGIRGNNVLTWCDLHGLKKHEVIELSKIPKTTHICKHCIQSLNEKNRLLEYNNKVMNPIVHAYKSAFENCRRHSPATKETGSIRSGREDGAFDFIPMRPTSIINYLETAISALELKDRDIRKDPIRFLDVGCGAGNVMLLATSLFLTNSKFGHCHEVDGIEYDKYYAELCKQLIGTLEHLDNTCPTRTHVFVQDALSFEDYGKYDIIYYWCPIQAEEKQKALEKLIEKQMKPGAILIPLMKRDKTLRKGKKFEIINPRSTTCESIYKKVR